MSDHARKDLHTKAKEAVVPDTTKSTGQRVKESVTDLVDKVAREVKPDHHKNIAQDTVDKTGRAKDNVKHGGTSESITHKIKEVFHPKHGANHTAKQLTSTGPHVDADIPK